MIVLEAVASGVVGVALLWLVLQPLLLPGVVAAPMLEPLDPEDTPRGRALLALKEIEFDRATGKLSDEDFASLHARYTTAALATLDATPANSDRVETLIAERVASQGTARFCTACGVPLPAGAQFCAQCGVAVR
ncbi:MAG: zinc ribbon domain-containing protein [Gemmatimonadota bacterium]